MALDEVVIISLLWALDARENNGKGLTRKNNLLEKKDRAVHAARLKIVHRAQKNVAASAARLKIVNRAQKNVAAPAARFFVVFCKNKVI